MGLRDPAHTGAILADGMGLGKVRKGGCIGQGRFTTPHLSHLPALSSSAPPPRHCPLLPCPQTFQSYAALYTQLTHDRGPPPSALLLAAAALPLPNCPPSRRSSPAPPSTPCSPRASTTASPRLSAPSFSAPPRWSPTGAMSSPSGWRGGWSRCSWTTPRQPCEAWAARGRVGKAVGPLSEGGRRGRGRGWKGNVKLLASSHCSLPCLLHTFSRAG